MLKIAWSPIYAHKLPEGHRFPMEKYDLLPEQLLFEGTINESNLFSPKPISKEVITLAHEQLYFEKLKNGNLSPQEIRRTGFPFSPLLVEREIMIMGGTVECALLALKNGVSLNIAGGTHHAFSDKGEGFCLLNDLAIAAHYLLYHKLANKILIVDLDVHQGDGTAQIFSNHSNVFTFSMHGANNFPSKKEKSTLDIALPDHTGDEDYLDVLEKNFKGILNQFQPDFILYQSGVDVLETDKLGKLSLTLQGCKERDRFVFSSAWQNKIPIAAAMGGGYSDKISTIIDAHANTFRVVQELYF